MNPFEKIFNYQIVSRLDDSGIFAVTGHERSWLKTCLSHPAAEEAFTAATFDKLAAMLSPDADLNTHEHIQQKAASKVKHVYHPLIRELRRAIMNRRLLRIDCRVKPDKIVKGEPAWPYKLEYSMVKREWYLLWYHTGIHSLMSTRLHNITALMELPCSAERSRELEEMTLKQIEKRKQQVVIQVVPIYNAELSRILYVFSCFEKEVRFDADTDTYTITVIYYGSESEFVLQRVRFLGLRVRVMDAGYMSNRMRETAANALARYAVT